MTVGELIEELSKHDNEEEVEIRLISNHSTYYVNDVFQSDINNAIYIEIYDM